jgi:hypothetical protein
MRRRWKKGIIMNTILKLDRGQANAVIAISDFLTVEKSQEGLFILAFTPRDYARLDGRCMAVCGTRPSAWLKTMLPGPAVRIDPVQLSPDYDRKARSFKFFVFIHPKDPRSRNPVDWAERLINAVNELMSDTDAQSLRQPAYHSPAGATVTREDVYEALDFLIAIDPDESELEACGFDHDKALGKYRKEADAAILTLRRYAEAIAPLTLPAMQEEYYSFTNDFHYLLTGNTVAVVTSSLNKAWDGVGPWSR